MQFSKHNIIFFTLFLFVSPAFSNEEAAPAKEEAGAIAATPVDEDFSGQQNEEWKTFQTELGVLKAKLDAEQAVLNELLLQKKNNKGSIGTDQVNQLNTHHKSFVDLAKEYNKKLRDFEMKFPEKGQELGRKYSRKESPSLSQMENLLTLDGRIRKINKKIKKQYESSNEKTVQASENKKSNQDAKSKAAPPSDGVTEKIIIVK